MSDHEHVWRLEGPDAQDAWCLVCYMSKRDLAEKVALPQGEEER